MGITRFRHGLSSWGVPVSGIGDPTIGNIYFVNTNTTASFYSEWYSDHYNTYVDGSENIHSTIATALAATVSDRNDYVVVMPTPYGSDITLTAGLTMAARSSHLLAPAGLGIDVGATQSCRVIMSTANTILLTISAAKSCEVAGFYFKNSACTSAAASAIYVT